MSEVPLEVTADILSRLPVKSPLWFRCVSNSWCALIDSPSHLNRSTETNINLSVIFRDGYIYSIDIDSLDRAVKLDQPLKSKEYETVVLGSFNGDRAVKLDHPWNCKEYGTLILGFCNDLLCLSDPDKRIVLWNFSTRKHHKLPVAPIGGFFGGLSDYGFGYDSIGDDYKVVSMVPYYRRIECRNEFYCDVAVYSLKSNSWRTIQDFPYSLRSKANVVVVSGALHWVVCRKSDSDEANLNLIAAFDFGVGEYRFVPQPDYMDKDKDFRMDIGALGGCLCINCKYAGDRIDVWVMKEYGIKESWTKLFSFKPSLVSNFDFVRPLLAYSKIGEKVLLNQDNTRLLWFDLRGKTVQKVRIPGLLTFYEGEICVGSLVPLHGDGG